jgi:two-component system, chemotaxis family, chemotaxis protein CheY
VDAPSNARTILIVEDDSRLRNGLGELLRQHGYVVVDAASGDQALEHLRTQRTDLILLDLRMPGMNGWQFRTEQRRDAALASIPVLVGTADWNAEGEAATLGAVACLKKPYNARDLVETVRRFSAA